jgi:pSer/pThr/pTyr-binding forkhead associated (FHA) protein
MTIETPESRGQNETNPSNGIGGDAIPHGQVGLKKVITLVTLTPHEDGSKPVFRIHKERIVIGTVVSADVRLTGSGIAPIHAVLELDQDGARAVIYDLASDTGVFVNGSAVVTQELKAGDRIRIGREELQFTVDDLEQLVLRERTRESEGRRLFLDPNEDFSPLLLEDERHVSQIFDYRPASKRAVEVIMSWYGTILDVEHFVKEKSVTIGTQRRSDFGIPPLLSRKEYAIVTRSGENFTLHIEPQMRGVLQRKGKLLSLDELRAEMRSGQGAMAVPLNEEDFAKVSVGDVDFYLSFTAAPPRLKQSRIFEKDPLFAKVLISSLILSTAVIGGLIGTYKPKPIEAEEIPERLATILYQPEKFQPKPVTIYKTELEDVTEEVKPPEPVAKKAEPVKPAPVPTVKVTITPSKTPKKPAKELHVAPKPTKPPVKVAKVAQNKGGNTRKQSEAKEGEGARAKGAEGSRGSKHAPKSADYQNKALRPSADGGQGLGGGNSQVEDVGNVDILKAATGKIQDILGSTAQKLGAGGEKLKGFGGFTSEGNGGLALSGKGAGGGGTADTTLGGLGKKGTGGGRVGTGKGAAGSGNGIIGGKARVAIRSGGPEEAVVMGSIDADAIEAAMMAHRDEFRRCYEKEINAEHPARGGRVGTNFVIGSTGRVTHASIESSTLKMEGAESCIIAVIKRIDFPIPRGAGVVQVAFPFKFNAIGNK